MDAAIYAAEDARESGGLGELNFAPSPERGYPQETGTTDSTHAGGRRRRRYFEEAPVVFLLLFSFY